MIDTVRGRLALWHTLVLAALLVAFASLSYGILHRTLARRTDAYLAASTSAVALDLGTAHVADMADSLAAEDALGEFGMRDLGFLVYDDRDRLVASDAPLPGDPGGWSIDTAMVHAAVRGTSGSPRFATIPRGRGGIRIYALPRHSVSGRRILVVGATSLDDQAALLAEFRTGFVAAIFIALLLSLAGGYALARRSLAPVVAMSERAAEIGATSLHERLPVANPNDELGQLARTFNDLLARLDTAFEQQRRFMADASHELRTPVAIMRGEADVALSQSERDPEEYRGALRVVRDEGKRLSRVVADLFLLARADSGRRPLQRDAVYLDELVAECVRAARALGVARGTTVTLTAPSLAPDPAAGDARADWPFEGDEELLRSLVMNLLDNAIKHSPAGSAVELRLDRDDASYRISVIDNGPGIPDEARAKVFERFYRVDRARAREAASDSGGAGLGLAIARWIAEAHRGSLILVESSPRGSRFEIALPRPRVASPAATAAGDHSDHRPRFDVTASS
ncbi:MAG TPA: ATP-binding protein [Gemmatimonadaceae bacterium]|nr:ATP-binding protein [Gemmatimonadaceae bacterium]